MKPRGLLNMFDKATNCLHTHHGPAIEKLVPEPTDDDSDGLDEPFAKECRQLLEVISQSEHKAYSEPYFTHLLFQDIDKFVSNPNKLKWCHIPSWMRTIIAALIETTKTRGNFKSSKKNFLIRAGVIALAFVMLKYATGEDPVSRLRDVTGIGKEPLTDKEQKTHRASLCKFFKQGTKICEDAQYGINNFPEDGKNASQSLVSLESVCKHTPGISTELPAKIHRTAVLFDTMVNRASEAQNSHEVADLAAAIKFAEETAEFLEKHEVDFDQLANDAHRVLGKTMNLELYFEACKFKPEAVKNFEIITLMIQVAPASSTKNTKEYQNLVWHFDKDTKTKYEKAIKELMTPTDFSNLMSAIMRSCWSLQ